MEEEDTRTRMDSSVIGSLLSNLTDELRTLIRGEIKLAQAEMSEKAAQTGKGVGSIAASGAVMFSGLLVLLAAAVYGLDNVISYGTTPWLSALIVGVVVLIIGALMLQAGRKKLQKAQHLTPERTVASFKNDKELGQQHSEQIKEDRK